MIQPGSLTPWGVSAPRAPVAAVESAPVHAQAHPSFGAGSVAGGSYGGLPSGGFASAGADAAGSDAAGTSVETRNLRDHFDYRSGPAYDATLREPLSTKGGTQPFMRSLTSMHHSPTRAEATHAERKRQEWLRDLSEQVSQKAQQKAQERAEREREERRESMAEWKMRQNADEQLREELARAGATRG